MMMMKISSDVLRFIPYTDRRRPNENDTEEDFQVAKQVTLDLLLYYIFDLQSIFDTRGCMQNGYKFQHFFGIRFFCVEE